ncbi:MAG TPA: PQQ-dependent sugar dehydrogenase [Tepidisphaeraceae bacterium]|jgi:glucose/arabinose dehydrogenase
MATNGCKGGAAVERASTHRLRSTAAAALVLCASVAGAQSLTDPDLTVQTFARGLSAPSGAAFVNTRSDLFVIEKNTGKVQFVRNRRVRRTLLDLPVANQSEQGLLGITLSPNFAADNYVYLYYTAAARDGAAPSANAIVRYKYDGDKLVFNRKIKTMPASPGPNHNGGKMAFGPDGKLYAAVGDLNRNETTSNFNNRLVSRTGAILRLEPWGASPTDNPFYAARNVGTRNEPLNDIYAYGVRNSFGLTFDPAGGRLWSSENGRTDYDEINQLNAGSNSGWEKIMGPAARKDRTFDGSPADLVSLGDRAGYVDPQMSWKACVAPTDLQFMPNGRLGNEYRGDLFVATTRGGAILHFDLTRDRDRLALTGVLADGVADSTDANRLAESEGVLFGRDFGTITELLPGPGGLYVLSFANGAIYRVTTTPDLAAASIRHTFTADAVLPEPTSLASVAVGGFLLLRRRRQDDAAIGKSGAPAWSKRMMHGAFP